MCPTQQQQNQPQQPGVGDSAPRQPLLTPLQWGGGENPPFQQQQQQQLQNAGFVMPYVQPTTGFAPQQTTTPGTMQPPQVPPGLQAPQQVFPTQGFTQQNPFSPTQGMALQQPFQVQQTPSGFQTSGPPQPFQQTMAMQPYPSPFPPQQGMGNFPMLQYPQNMMGFYAGPAQQTWTQASSLSAPPQINAMEVDDDVSRSSTRHRSNQPSSCLPMTTDMK